LRRLGGPPRSWGSITSRPSTIPSLSAVSPTWRCSQWG